MKYALVLIILILAGPSFCTAEGTTPYGDYSEGCSAYGTCKEDIGEKEAENAIERYFSNKGMTTGNMRHRGRFIEAEVYKDNKFQDKVIFDRKTGRVRSTY